MWYFSLTPWSLAQTDRRHINRHVKRTCPVDRRDRALTPLRTSYLFVSLSHHLLRSWQLAAPVQSSTTNDCRTPARTGETL